MKSSSETFYATHNAPNQENQDNRRQTKHHLSLLKDGRGAKEEDNSQVTEPLEALVTGLHRYEVSPVTKVA